MRKAYIILVGRS